MCVCVCVCVCTRACVCVCVCVRVRVHEVALQKLLDSLLLDLITVAALNMHVIGTL